MCGIAHAGQVVTGTCAILTMNKKSISRSEAEILATTFLNEGRSGISEIQLVDDETLEEPFGWVFRYATKKFIETRDWRHILGGGGPLVIRREDGSIWYYGPFDKISDILVQHRKMIGGRPELSMPNLYGLCLQPVLDLQQSPAIAKIASAGQQAILPRPDWPESLSDWRTYINMVEVVPNPGHPPQINVQVGGGRLPSQSIVIIHPIITPESDESISFKQWADDVWLGRPLEKLLLRTLGVTALVRSPDPC